MIRTNQRKLDRDIFAIKQVENKTRTLILQADKRGQRDPARAKQARLEVRGFAQELVRARKTGQRLAMSKAQLSSVQMQVNETFALRKIEGSIRASVSVMKDVKQLVKLPELALTMRELSMELMKAGVIEEMVEEMLPQDEAYGEEEDEVEEMIDQVLADILKDKKDAVPAVPVAVPRPVEEQRQPQVPTSRQKVQPVAAYGGSDAAQGGSGQQYEDAVDEDEDPEAMMNEMRNRLEALRS